VLGQIVGCTECIESAGTDCGMYIGYLECWDRLWDVQRVLRVLGQIVECTEDI